MRSSSQQTMLDAFFGNLFGDGALTRGVSDRAFAKARSHLHVPALVGLNDQLLAQADAAGLLERWQGLLLVAADASVLRPAIRRCKRTRGLAAADGRLFALYLPGPELTLHAAVHSEPEIHLIRHSARDGGATCGGVDAPVGGGAYGEATGRRVRFCGSFSVSTPRTHSGTVGMLALAASAEQVPSCV